MTLKQRKILYYLSYEILLFVILVNNLILTIAHKETLVSIQRIVASIMICGSLLIIIFSNIGFTVECPAKITKTRKILLSLAWAFAGFVVFSRFGLISIREFWAILALCGSLPHFVLELVLYLKGDLEIK